LTKKDDDFGLGMISCDSSQKYTKLGTLKVNNEYQLHKPRFRTARDDCLISLESLSSFVGAAGSFKRCIPRRKE
jgi:hypothetical protein